jgi:hypothetical protein
MRVAEWNAEGISEEKQNAAVSAALKQNIRYYLGRNMV